MPANRHNCRVYDRLSCRVDLETGAVTVLGSHEKPVRCVEYNSSTGTVLTGGWDAKFNAWDPRSKQPLVQSRPAPGKVG